MTGGLRLDKVGRALRLLRLRGGRRQYQVAAAAGITKAMLSAYETGRRLPSLKTLGPLLDALDADLADLHQALVAALREDATLAHLARSDRDRDYPPAAPADSEIGEPAALRSLLRVSGPPPTAEERALAEILHGFHRLLRCLQGDDRAVRVA